MNAAASPMPEHSAPEITAESLLEAVVDFYESGASVVRDGGADELEQLITRRDELLAAVKGGIEGGLFDPLTDQLRDLRDRISELEASFLPKLEHALNDRSQRLVASRTQSRQVAKYRR